MKLSDSNRVFTRLALSSFQMTALAVAISPWVNAQEGTSGNPHDKHNQITEVLVSGERQRALSDTAFSAFILSGDLLRESVAASLGETLKSQPGVNSASYGQGVGQPIIRGQGGSRVQILQNSLGTTDAASVSPDHANGVETFFAERVEVIRGPSTLLYGNGAIGGVVNVIDNRIPDEIPEQLEAKLEFSHDTVNEGNTGKLLLEGGAGSFAWHFDATSTDTDDVEIDGLAIDEVQAEALEELLAGGEDEGEEEPIENTDGFIANSDLESEDYTFGASWVGERGFAGFSVSRFESEYGLPPGAHHEEEGEDGEDSAEEEEEEVVRIDLEQTRYSFNAGYDLDSVFNRVDARIVYTDYEHIELEGAEAGTEFTNEGFESRFTLNHQGGESLKGTLGLQWSDREFAAIGEEAFIPEADTQAIGIFAIESVEVGDWIYEAGLRVDFNEVETDRCSNDETNISGSVSALWKISDQSSSFINLNHSERSPAIEELFSNLDEVNCTPRATTDADLVQHVATQRFEIGGFGELDTETSNNIELGFRQHAGDVLAEVNFFFNQISDYIFLADVGVRDEVIISQYLQEDAEFYGAEAQVLFPINLTSNHHIDVTLFSDFVRAELDNGDDLPRIPALKYGFELGYALNDAVGETSYNRR